MAREGRLWSRVRRLAVIALEDFGLRPSSIAPRSPIDPSAGETAADPGAVLEAPAPVELAAPVEVAATGAVDPGAVLEAPAPVEVAATGAVDPGAVLEAPVEVAATGAAEMDGLPPGIVWRGSARRSPELQRFCDHLGAQDRASLVD